MFFHVLIIFIVDIIPKRFHVSSDWHDEKSEMSHFQAHNAIKCKARAVFNSPNKI
jgi:hypothetical protein